jgi:hypothetical protein
MHLTIVDSFSMINFINNCIFQFYNSFLGTHLKMCDKIILVIKYVITLNHQNTNNNHH